jgi:hypothetical protein
MPPLGNGVARDFGFFHVKKYPTSLWNIGGFTQVLVHGTKGFFYQ